MTSSKKTHLTTSKVQKKTTHLTIALLSLGKKAIWPQLLTCQPKILWGVRIWTPFRVPGPERRVIGRGDFDCSGGIDTQPGVSESFWHQIRTPRTRNPHPILSWVPEFRSGGFTGPNRFRCCSGWLSDRSRRAAGTDLRNPKKYGMGVLGAENSNLLSEWFWHPALACKKPPKILFCQ